MHVSVFWRLSISLMLVIGVSCKKENELEVRPTSDMVLKELRSYSNFVFRRHLKAENYTGSVMEEVLNNFRTTLNESISVKLVTLNRQVVAMVESQLRKYPTALFCAKEVFNTVQETIADGLEQVEYCIDTAERNLKLLWRTFWRVWEEYEIVEEAAVKGIKHCFRVHTDCQNEEIARCVKTPKDTLFYKGKRITANYFTASPFMNNFKKVAFCIDTAAESIDKAVEEYIRSLFICADNIPDEEFKRNFAAQKPNISRYLINSTLVSQIEKSQEEFDNLNSKVEKGLYDYYAMEVEAETRLLFEEQTDEDIFQSVKKALDPYFMAIEDLCINPEDAENMACVDYAKTNLNCLSKEIQNQSRRCDSMMVEAAKDKIESIRTALMSMVYSLSFNGNPSILNCTKEVPLFKTNAIEECYNLTLKGITLTMKSDVFKDVQEAIESLQMLDTAYFGLEESPLACEPMIFEKYLLRAERELYDLGRCIFNQSGQDYNIIPKMVEANTSKILLKQFPNPPFNPSRYKRSTEDNDGLSILFGVLRVLLSLMFTL